MVRYDLDARTQLPRVIAMRDRLRHRGPDGEGAFADPYCALGHTRLALVDVEGGAQPMRSPDGRYVLVYNGELYNCDELRARLKGPFRTRSDAEVLLRAYVEFGDECVRQLDGMFAFFIWDAWGRRGFGARDRLGVKPFVYSWEGGELRFASEAKALIAKPGVRREALLEVLAAPCFSGVEQPLFDGIEYLPPGHRLTVSPDGVSIDRWGGFDLTSFSDQDQSSALREALTHTVERAVAADSPVGLFLSGGLDSTLLAALARRSSPPAFTIAFPEQERYDYTRSRIVISDDGPFARQAAGELGLEQELVYVERNAADLAALAAQNDALPAWEQELAQHHLARAAARRVKAVLVGDAADETHWGYHFLLDEEATRTPARILERFSVNIIRKGLLADPIGHFDAHYRALALAAGNRWDRPYDRLLATAWLIVHRWLPRLLHNGDIHTMAHSLEARVPFAGERVLEIAGAVGPERGLKNGVEKAGLREAARGLLSDSLRLRRKSALPKDQGNSYQREAARLLDGIDHLVDADRVRALCRAEVLDERERAALFRVICLAHWARAHGARL